MPRQSTASGGKKPYMVTLTFLNFNRLKYLASALGSVHTALHEGKGKGKGEGNWLR